MSQSGEAAGAAAQGLRGGAVIERLALPALLFAYAAVPGNPNGWFPGPPWRMAGALLLTALLIAAVLERHPVWSVRTRRLLLAGLLLAALGRGWLSAGILPRGWSSSVEVPEAGGDRANRIGRQAADGDVVEARPALSNESATFQFFNDHAFAAGGTNRALNRSWTVTWRGFVRPEQVTMTQWTVEATHPVVLRLYGLAWELTPGSETPVGLVEGIQSVSVIYHKPEGQPGRVRVRAFDERGRPLRIYANEPSDRALALDARVRPALWALNSLALIILAAWLFAVGRQATAWIRSLSWGSIVTLRGGGYRAVVAALLLGFCIQGMVRASPASRLLLFQNGDDMRDYAAGGRDIAIHGLWANGGKPLGTGEPFFYYPLYQYFVGASHRLFDESLFGLVFLQFLLLGVTVLLVMEIARSLFGVRAAWLSLAGLMLLAQVDFARWYTVSCFSDNLYYAMVAGAVLAAVRLAQRPSWTRSLLAGALGGAAALTRPSMMTFLPLAGLWLIWMHRRGPARWRGWALAALFGASWLAVVSLATLRNFLVSGRPVFLVESYIQMIAHLCPPGVNYRDYLPEGKVAMSLAEGVNGVLRLMSDHPQETAIVLLKKMVFMAGWMRIPQYTAYRIHPEFLLLTLGYVTWWCVARRTAARIAIVHLFLLSHILAMLISTPHMYGYKIILTNMMLFVPFAAMAAAVLWRRATRRSVATAS